MKSSIKSLAILLVALSATSAFAKPLKVSPSVITAKAPVGLANVMSVYRDRETGESILVRGYGVVLELAVVMPDQHIERQYLIQTVPHLTQGGLDPGSPAHPLPAKLMRQTPRLLVEIAQDSNREIFGSFAEDVQDPAWPEITGSKKVVPLIGGSYYESFDDRELLVLSPDALPQTQLPVAVRLTYVYPDRVHSKIDFPLPALSQQFRWSRDWAGLSIPCLKMDQACPAQRTLVGALSGKNTLASRIFRESSIAAFYDHWIPYATHPGMSGLPVFRMDNVGRISEIIGLVSGASPQTQDTWLSKFDPMDLFIKFASQAPADGHLQSTAYFGSEHFIWVMENQTLVRIGQNAEFALQESGFGNSEGNGWPPLRCSHGSGFRLDNGSGFRVDNGDGLCVGDFHQGQDFTTQIRGGLPETTALMKIENSLGTWILPPTATGFGSFFELNLWDPTQQAQQTPSPVKFDILSRAKSNAPNFVLSQSSFSSFESLLFKSVGQGWRDAVAVTLVDKTNPAKLQVQEGAGTVELLPTWDAAGLISVQIKITSSLTGALETQVSYRQLDQEHSIGHLIQKVSWQGRSGSLNLAGLLTLNPDLIRTPNLQIQNGLSETSSLQETVLPGDPEIGTLFTLTAGTKVFYFTTQK